MNTLFGLVTFGGPMAAAVGAVGALGASPGWLFFTVPVALVLTGILQVSTRGGEAPLRTDLAD